MTGFIVLSAVMTVVAVALHRYLSGPKTASLSQPLKWSLTLGAYVVGTGLAFIAMPVSGDAMKMPADLVLTFRALSLAGLEVQPKTGFETNCCGQDEALDYLCSVRSAW
ncbi:MAG: hypothetical protein HYX94_13120 [Chloroflexi bacterium]|nr:hypothetical protein [Chloroflexota bacterium]